jgi:hypothetical protein
MNINILKNISNKDITFIKDVSKLFKIDKTGEFKYFINYNFDIKGIKQFILTLDDKSIYTIIPFISINCKTDDPFLTLSKQILVTKYSNYETINNYLGDKLNDAVDQFMFNENGNNHFYLIFKYKKFKIDFNEKF